MIKINIVRAMFLGTLKHDALIEESPVIPDLEGMSERALRKLASDLVKAGDAEDIVRVLLEMLQEQERELKSLNIDTLTGLVNRSGFNLILEYEIAQNNRVMYPQGESRLCLIYGDLTGFKSINDNHGHNNGDDALKHVARVIHASARQSDIIARLGGDEFGVILPDCGIKQAIQVAERITKKFNEMPFMIEGKIIPLGINLGVCTHGLDENSDDFIARADRMMIEAKEQHYRDKGLTRRGAVPPAP